MTTRTMLQFCSSQMDSQTMASITNSQRSSEDFKCTRNRGISSNQFTHMLLVSTEDVPQTSCSKSQEFNGMFGYIEDAKTIGTIYINSIAYTLCSASSHVLMKVKMDGKEL